MTIIRAVIGAAAGFAMLGCSATRFDGPRKPVVSDPTGSYTMTTFDGNKLPYGYWFSSDAYGAGMAVIDSGSLGVQATTETFTLVLHFSAFPAAVDTIRGTYTVTDAGFEFKSSGGSGPALLWGNDLTVDLTPMVVFPGDRATHRMVFRR